MALAHVRLTSGIRIVLILALALIGTALARPAEAPAEPSGHVRVIVELDSPAALAAVDARSPGRRAEAWEPAGQRAAALRQEQYGLLQRADRAGVDVAVVHQLTAAYNGIAAEVAAADVDKLRAMPGVRAVHHDAVYQHALADSVPLVGAPEVWQQTDPDGVPVTGAGSTVAVIDTGIDYTHPDLGGGFGPGHKVVAGHDFVNDDADPMDDNGHGTHVAGIVAADGKVRGVAPDATLTAYKVLNQSGNGQLSDIIAGLDAAVDPANPHRADVVNLSLSGPGDGTDPLSVAADQAADAGVVVVAAAGNLGPFPQSIRSPASAERVLAVGASATGVQVPRARMTHPTSQDLRAARLSISAAAPETPRLLDVVDVGRGVPGSYEDIDVTGKAVLIDHFPFETALEKVVHAEQRGAAAAFVYVPDSWGFGGGQVARPATPGRRVPDDFQDAFEPGFDDGRLDEIVAVVIPGASAATLQRHLAEGSDVQVEISGVDATDQLADFSSRGPGGRLTPKPDLVAPGVEILSTLPNGTHGRASGTSMAAPHVAGAAALLRQLHPRWSPDVLAAALTGPARLLDDAGPLDQGGGRLDITAAASTHLVTEPTSLAFGLADLSDERINRTRRLTLRNIGDNPATVDLSVRLPKSREVAASVEPNIVQLAPDESVEVEVRLDLTTPEADADVIGWVVADDGDGSYEVPFLLAVRHLGVHVTPDPAPAGTQTTVYVSSRVDLAAPPVLEVTCPGISPQRPEAEPDGTRAWRATAKVVDAGVCQVSATGSGAGPDAPLLTGAGAFEAVAAPDPGRGVDRWQPIGPNATAGRLAFGVTNNPNQMAVVPTTSPSVFASQDRMRTWRELRTMPMAGGNPVSAATPRDGGELYVAVNGVGDNSYTGRIMRTDDGGANWESIPWPDEPIQEIALDTAGTALAAVTNGQLRVTTDEGEHWTELPGQWNNPRDIHWIDGDLYVASFDGLVVIRDAAGPGPHQAEVLFQPPLLGWAAAATGDSETIAVSSVIGASVHVSRDGGETFEQVLQTRGLHFVTMTMVDGDIYALQEGGDVWIGRDRGVEWESWGRPGSGRYVDLGTSPWSDSVYAASPDAGLYSADEPNEFQRVGVPGAWVFDIAITGAADNRALVAGTRSDTFRTTLRDRAAIMPDDLEWETSGAVGVGFQARFVAASPTDPSVVYKVVPDAFDNFGIWRSDDGGVTWSRKSTPSENPLALMIHPADPDRVYISYWSLVGVGLVVSTDGGETWAKIDQGQQFVALAGDPTNPDRIWAGTGPGSFHQGLWVSEDGGLSFERLSDEPVTAIAVDPNDPDRLVVGGRGLYSSSDDGQTVQRADHVDLDMWVTDIVFAPGDSGRVFAAAGAFYDELGALKGGRGVLASEDGGASWESLTTGLSNPNVTSLALDSDGRYLFAGVGGGSVHRIELGD